MSHRFYFSVLAMLACALGALASPLDILWIDGGVPLCTVPYDQEDLVIAADGAGGAIVAWEGPHSTTEWDIHCQRLNGRGAPLWAVDGAPVCEAAGAQTQAAIASDGAGGAYLCWTDNRNGDWDVYAQRIGADGSPAWTLDGIPIARLDYEQSNNQIIPDGAGGAIIVWHSYSTENGWDILAQRVTPEGNVLWAVNGILVCDAASSQVFAQIVPDGSGGAVIVWQDSRTAIPHIYAQRIDASGNRLWTGDGVAVCTAATGQHIPHLASDGAGGAIFTWYDNRNSWADIYAQRVNAAGVPLWTADGVAVCTSDREQYNPRIVSDGAGGAIIAWHDLRSQANYDIYAQRLNAVGTPLWTADGIALCTLTGDQKDTRIVSDGAGGAVIAWNSPGHVHIQRLDPDGTPLWVSNGVSVAPGSGATINAELISLGVGGAIVAWEDLRAESNDIYAGLFDNNGALVATLLAGWHVACREGAVALSWELSAPVPCDRFTIWRRDCRAVDAPWTALSVAVEADGLAYGAIDVSCEPGATYVYRVNIVEDGATRALFETGAVTAPALALALRQNHPNPFNPSTTISFTLPRESEATVEIFDGAGRLVARLLDGERLPAGAHEAAWDGRDLTGRTCAAGVYFCRLSAGKETRARKMVLAR